MTKPSLIIQELSIYKIPGFPKGMESLGSLAPNINIIGGPNASGKSSTARIIQDILWLQNTKNIHAECKLEINGKIWSITIDNGYISCQCEGIESVLPSLPAYDESKRYFLALHELIRDNDADLAQMIMREAVGGYDLQKAHQSLGLKGTLPNRGLSEYKNFENKRQKIAAIQDRQQDLQKEEKKLSELREEYTKAKDAVQWHRLYEHIIDFLKAKHNYEYLETQQSGYPSQLALLIGNEHDEICRLEDEINENEQKMRSILQQKQNKEEEFRSLELPADGIKKEVLDELQSYVDKAGDLERSLEHKRMAIAKIERETKVALSHLFTNLKAENLETLHLEDVHRLDEFFSDAYTLLSKKQALENKIEHLEKEKGEILFSEELLNDGKRLLLLWIERDEPASTYSAQNLWVLFILGLLTVPLTYFLSWMAGLLGTLAMLVYILIVNKRPQKSNLRETRIRDYRKTGLKEPVEWKMDAVSTRIEELYEELHIAKQQSEINRQLRDLRYSLHNLQPKVDELEKERNEWIERLSNIPELRGENIERYSGLYWFLRNLHEWQKNNNELQATHAAYGEEKKAYEFALASINSLLEGLPIAVSTSQEGKAIVNKLQQEVNRRNSLHLEIVNLTRQINELTRLKARDEEALKSIYVRLNLKVGQKNQLKFIIDQKTDYDRFIKDLEQSKRSLKEKGALLKSNTLYEKVKDKVPSLQVEDAETHKARYGQLASNLEALNTQIVTVETRIGQERHGYALEEALAESDFALNDLEHHYQNMLSSLTGDLIVECLKEEAQERSRSQVFIRANQLFNRITHGRYELIIDERKGGEFKAKDLILNRGQELDELSSGTRIQLLIAVRLAFIESQEQGIKLPILADEVLANSDDIRAKQIIEALIEVSKEGRQIFYFTAQADEIKKWQEYLDRNPNVKGAFKILQGQASDDINYHIVEERNKPSLQLVEVLSPEGLSYQDYHRKINPPSYDLLVDEPAQLHLSYLIDDSQLLYACLQRNLKFYGQLSSFLKHKGTIEGFTEMLVQTIDHKIELLKFYQKLYQRGRSKPIDRQVIEESKCVSATFMDQVCAKLKELKYNPILLIVALRAGEVPRFTRAKIDELEEYLEVNNYIDISERLSQEELKIRTQAFLSNLTISPSIASDFLNRIVD